MNIKWYSVPLLVFAVCAPFDSFAQAAPQQRAPSPASDQGGNTRVPSAGAGQGTPGTVRGPGAPGARPERPAAYPARKVDPAKADRGKALFGINCAFCHGSDARGGEGGPNLIRSALVLEDNSGEHIAPTVQNGRIDRGMPKFDLDMARISEIAEYLHSLKVGGRDISRMTPPSILVGNAEQGRAFFDQKCAGCHSASGDLKGIASRIPDPKILQQTWVMPGGGGRGFGPQPAVHLPSPTVTVTDDSGKKFEGKVDRIDDFSVSLTDSDGIHRTFRRDGDKPAVVIHDPLEPHRNLLPTYSDKDIHNLTAYLETFK